MTTSLVAAQPRWVRSPDGLIAGVCQGLAERYAVGVWLVRALWLAAVLMLGTGVVLYLVLALTLPRADRTWEAEQKKFLGVCWRLSRVTGLEVGLVRALAIFAAFASFGAALVVYAILYFVLPDAEGPTDYGEVMVR